MLTSAELDTEFQKLAIDGKWQELLDYRGELTLQERNRFLWAWPSLTDLTVLKWMLEDFRIETLLSVGCGSGLLEWILSKATGVSVNGLEVDESWWTSRYSPRSFISLNFVNGPDMNLEEIAETRNFALLFCYFNECDAFNEYVDAFQGKWIVIIGPGEGKRVYTEPMPLNPCFRNKKEWRLETNFTLVEGDVVAFYRRRAGSYAK